MQMTNDIFCYNYRMIVLKNKNRKHLFITVPIIFISVLLAWLLFLNKQEKSVSSNDSTITKPQIVNKTTRINFSAMGDMLAHDTITLNAKANDGYDYSKYFQYIHQAYSDSDIIFCNQEGLSSGDSYGISGYPSFNAPKEFAIDLSKAAGCNLINLANNHIGDKGTQAIEETLKVWDSLKPLAHSGANKSLDEQKNIKYFTINDVKFSFLAFAEFSNKPVPNYSVNMFRDKTLFHQLLKEARDNSDILIVSMHWGTEDSNHINSEQLQLTKELSEYRADIVVGTGPHYLQKYDQIKRTDGKFMHIWYSLGNMLSSQIGIKNLIGGIAKIQIIKTSEGLNIENPAFIPTYMHYEWTQAQRNNNDLLSRKNPMIYLLKDAEGPLNRSLFQTTVAEQENYVRETVGSLSSY